jgi:hypothetical protein
MTYNITIAKTSQNFAIDFDTLPESSKNYIIGYGLKQCLNDCHSAFKDVAEAKDIVQSKVDALLSGQCSLKSSGATRVANPIEREVQARCLTFLVSQTKKKPKDIKAILAANNLTASGFLESKGEAGVKIVSDFRRKAEADAKANAKLGEGFVLDLSL